MEATPSSLTSLMLATLPTLKLLWCLPPPCALTYAAGLPFFELGDAFADRG
jgi:hypothetical protein